MLLLNRASRSGISRALIARNYAVGIDSRNHRRWAFLGRLQDLAPAPRRELAVAYFDLDGFKEINDAYGHGAGDLVLSEVGRRLSGAVRAGELAARLGGDEFAVVLDPVSGLDDARRAATRLAAAITAPVRVGEVEVPVAVSVGVSLFLGDIESALAAADRGLYAQKAARREQEQAGVGGLAVAAASARGALPVIRSAQ